ncbi:hypothetical protein BD779DRAFT_1611807 [Infundibulicybe gibba]|nr:hypothetical protein BD779DRAFT_1611807 [Infundibulicybe gibba]
MKIAVVGSGVSGLAATWLLNEHSEHEVHLYEADDRPGGHANTVQFTPPGKTREDGIDVDTTYPNFLGFLTRLGIPVLPTEMTFSVSRDGGMFEWAGNNLRTVFCQPSRLLDPAMWRLIYDLLRFNACARELVMDTDAGRTKKEDEEEEELSIGEYLTREGYSQSFRDNYLIPMTAAIWSTPPDKCAMDFPARTLIQFMHNHHLLQVTGKPSWLTIQGGSQKYVSAILAKLPKSQLHLSTPVLSLSNMKDGPATFVDLTTAAGTEMYDRVILACHSDAALRILRANGNPTQEQEEILGADAKEPSGVVVWNYLTQSVRDVEGRVKANCDEVAFPFLTAIVDHPHTDGMNDLQHIPESKYGPVLVTLNPPFEPEASTVVGRYKYDHPVLNAQVHPPHPHLPG